MPYGYGNRAFAKPVNPKRWVGGSTTFSADTTQQITLTLPIDASQGRAIQLWSLDIEISVMTWIAADKNLSVFISRSSVSAEKFINDPDVLAKWKIHTECAAASAMPPVPNTYTLDFYPAIPYFGSQIYVGVTNATGGTPTVYVKLWYTDLYMDPRQMLASLQSSLV